MLTQQELPKSSKKMGGLGFVLAHHQGQPCPTGMWPWLCTLEGHCWRSSTGLLLSKAGVGDKASGWSPAHVVIWVQLSTWDLRSWWGRAPTQPSLVGQYLPGAQHHPEGLAKRV